MRIALFSIATFITLMHTANCQQRPSLPDSKNRLIVIAHRGDHVDQPENTLAAYEKAIAHGADYVEIDLRTTKDGELVIMHDATVDRMTNGQGKVSDLTYSQLNQLKVIDKKLPGSKEYSVPLFNEVLRICKGKIGIYLDFKEADPAKAYALIKEAGMEKNVVVYLNKEEQYSQWKNVAPGMPLMSSPPENAKDKKVLQHFLDQWNISVMDGSLNEYTDEMLTTAAKNNVAVWLDVQSENEGPAKWDKALQRGIKGLQTDHPGQLIQYLKQKGKR